MSFSDACKEAIESNDLPKLDALLANLQDDQQSELRSLLPLAVQQASLDMIKLLLQRGAKLWSYPISLAIRREEPEILQLFLDFGWDIDSNESAYPAIHLALTHEVLLRWLLEKGANPNVWSRRPRGSCNHVCSAVSSAAALTDPTPLRILFEYGADVDPEALWHAVGRRRQHNGTATMAVLLEHGADINFGQKKHITPLAQAARRNDREKVRFLLEHGADPGFVPPGSKLMALDYAKRGGFSELYDMLEVAPTQDVP